MNARSPANTTTETNRGAIASNLYIYNLAHDNVAQDLEHHRRRNHILAIGVPGHLRKIARRDETQCTDHDNRQYRQHHAGEASVRTGRSYLALQAEALANQE